METKWKAQGGRVLFFCT